MWLFVAACVCLCAVLCLCLVVFVFVFVLVVCGCVCVCVAVCSGQSWFRHVSCPLLLKLLEDCVEVEQAKCSRMFVGGTFFPLADVFGPNGFV